MDAARIEAQTIIQEVVADYLTFNQLFDPTGMSLCNKANKIFATVYITEAVNEVLPLDKSRPPAADML
ncbi:MAG: hypothetical protein FJX25_19380 [Alphaproteobacteria bacterium]|nr:hypothetical protein [Alphaproteobacteria bacterium]